MKVRLLTTPAALPGKCAVCGSVGGDGRQFVDFDWQMDWYGAVYFCSFCITEVLETLDYVSRDKHNALAEENATNILKLETALKQIEVLKNVLRDAFGIDPDTVDYSADTSGDVLPANEVSQSLEGSSDGTVEPQSDADESSNSEGPVSVRKSSARTSKSRESAAAGIEF